MSQAPAGTDEDKLNQASRKVLLDALIALEGHREALTVVGAQAVYLRTTDAVISSASYTSDGDISIDPDVLGEQPLLEEAMRGAGFTLKLDKNGHQQVGLWERPEQVGEVEVGVELDLLVPQDLAPGSKKKRRTEMPPHDGWSAKKVPGLEVAAVDRSLMTIASLTPHDDRSVEAYVSQAPLRCLSPRPTSSTNGSSTPTTGNQSGCPPRTPETSTESCPRSGSAR